MDAGFTMHIINLGWKKLETEKELYNSLSGLTADLEIFALKN